MVSPEVRKGFLTIYFGVGSLECGIGTLPTAKLVMAGANTDLRIMASLAVGVSTTIVMGLFAILLVMRSRVLIRYGTPLFIAALSLSFTFTVLQIPKAAPIEGIYAFLIGGCIVMAFFFYFWTQVRQDILKSQSS